MSFALPPIAGTQGRQQTFYSTLNKLFPFEHDKQQGRSLGGYAALSNDAANVLITAVRYLRKGSENIPITPGAVWREITEIHTPKTPEDNELIEGVTGTINFGGDIPRHVPRNKPITILRVHNGEIDPNAVEICEVINGRANPAWCPTDP
jgi:hypothetical protein